MTKKEKNKLEIHGGKETLKISSEHNQDENTSTTKEVIHYKRGYMALEKENKKVDNHSNCETKPVSQEEFDRMLKIALNTPPRKRTKKDRNKVVRN